MVLFNNIPYKLMRLTSKVNLTKRFSKNISACANNQTLRYYKYIPKITSNAPSYSLYTSDQIILRLSCI